MMPTREGLHDGPRKSRDHAGAAGGDGDDPGLPKQPK